MSDSELAFALQCRIDEIEAENERLREALRQIATLGLAVDVQGIAEVALAEVDDE